MVGQRDVQAGARDFCDLSASPNWLDYRFAEVENTQTHLRCSANLFELAAGKGTSACFSNLRLEEKFITDEKMQDLWLAFQRLQTCQQ
jgi:hypothetical protein